MTTHTDYGLAHGNHHRPRLRENMTFENYTYDGDNVIADISGGSLVRSYVTPMLDENISMTVHGATNEAYYYN